MSGTNILVAATSDGRQLTVYQNEVALPSRNRDGVDRVPQAMILPCPLSDGQKVELVDLSSLEHLFKHCSSAFPFVVTINNSRGLVLKSTALASSLAVHQVGSYSVSIAPTLADLRRVDPSVFKLADNVDALLAKHYARGFGFVVCKFNEGKKMHPIGYIHPRPTNDPNRLFVPTRHEHGEDHGSAPDWDHNIFSLCCDSDSGQTPKETAVAKSANLGPDQELRSGNMNDFGVSFVTLRNLIHNVLPDKFVLRRQEIKGHHENEDLWFNILPSFLGDNPSYEDANKFFIEEQVSMDDILAEHRRRAQAGSSSGPVKLTTSLRGPSRISTTKISLGAGPSRTSAQKISSGAGPTGSGGGSVTTSFADLLKE